MAKKQLPALSSAETQILRLVWQLGEGTVQEVCDKLPPNRNISYATVQTLLRRLEAKGYINHHPRGKAYVFHPTAKPDDVIKRTVGDFVERLFGGDPLPLMMHLAGKTKLKPDDVKRIKNILKGEDKK